jgi:Tfp pilus assembly protein PilO
VTLRPRRRGFDLRERLWLIAGIFAVLLGLNAGFYLLLNLPRLRSLEALRSEREDVRRDLRTATGRIATMKELIARYDEEVERLEDFYGRRLGTQAERMTAIQKEIRSIGGEFHIDPESIDYNPAEVEGTDLMQLQITMPLLGGYPNLRQFVNRIESSEHLLIVDSIELAGSREGGAMLNLTIKIATFFRAPGRAPEPARARATGAAAP